MKKRLAVLAAAAVLTVSGCYGNNNPSGTERDKDITTASGTEEVTTTTDAESMTTAVTADDETKPEISLTAPTGEVSKTFEIGFEYRNNRDADDTVQSPFDEIFAADCEAYIPVFSAANAEFMAALRNEDDLSDAAELLEPYADGDMLINFMLRELPQTKLYHIFEDDLTASCYRLSDNYLFCDSDPENVTLYMKNSPFTAYRKAVELLWANYEIIKPISVTAVYDTELAREQEEAQVKICPYWLKISASANKIDEIRKAFEENGIEKSVFEFVEDPDTR